MELLFGDDLSARIKQRGAVTQDAAIAIVVQVCKALEHAHQQGVVHRDIKPENIMVCRQPDSPAREIVKVLDFGTAKIFDAKAQIELQSDSTSVRAQLTRVGSLVGTPAYMSPEQGRAEAVDARSDIYSVGVLLFELLCGRTPFLGETPLQIVARHVHEAPPAPSSLVAIPRELERIVLRCLEKSPAHRPQSASELAALLETALPNVMRTTGRGADERWRRFTGRGVAPGPALVQQPNEAKATVASSPLSAPPDALPQAKAQLAQELKSTLPMKNLGRQDETSPGIRLIMPAAQQQEPPPQAAQQPVQADKVDKLIRLVTILLVLLAVACVAIGVLLFAFVAR
jgi:serine/threonine-protein kinase